MLLSMCCWICVVVALERSVDYEHLFYSSCLENITWKSEIAPRHDVTRKSEISPRKKSVDISDPKPKLGHACHVEIHVVNILVHMLTHVSSSLTKHDLEPIDPWRTWQEGSRADKSSMVTAACEGYVLAIPKVATHQIIVVYECSSSLAEHL